MPTYEYRCNSCGNVQEEMHSIKSDPEIPCKSCESTEPLTRLISQNLGGFVVKGDTSTKLWKETRLRHKKNADLELKQIERYGNGPKLNPNVAGEATESWSDAQKLAKEAGIDPKTYDSYVASEKSTDSSGSIDDRKWKKAKEDKHKA
jgi:putative FmdB family regulatory protein